MKCRPGPTGPIGAMPVFADGIQLITVLATFGLFLIESLLKITEKHVVWLFFNKVNGRRVNKTINISKGRQPRLF